MNERYSNMKVLAWVRGKKPRFTEQCLKKKFFFSFIYLAVWSLHAGSLVPECVIQFLDQGSNSSPPELGARHLSHWTTGDVPTAKLSNLDLFGPLNTSRKVPCSSFFFFSSFSCTNLILDRHHGHHFDHYYRQFKQVFSLQKSYWKSVKCYYALHL